MEEGIGGRSQTITILWEPGLKEISCHYEEMVERKKHLSCQQNFNMSFMQHSVMNIAKQATAEK